MGQQKQTLSALEEFDMSSSSPGPSVMLESLRSCICVLVLLSLTLGSPHPLSSFPWVSFLRAPYFNTSLHHRVWRDLASAHVFCPAQDVPRRSRDHEDVHPTFSAQRQLRRCQLVVMHCIRTQTAHAHGTLRSFYTQPMKSEIKSKTF